MESWNVGRTSESQWSAYRVWKPSAGIATRHDAVVRNAICYNSCCPLLRLIIQLACQLPPATPANLDMIDQIGAYFVTGVVSRGQPLVVISHPRFSHRHQPFVARCLVSGMACRRSGTFASLADLGRAESEPCTIPFSFGRVQPVDLLIHPRRYRWQ